MPHRSATGFFYRYLEQGFSTIVGQDYLLAFDIGVLSPSTQTTRDDLASVLDAGGFQVAVLPVVTEGNFTSAPLFKQHSLGFKAISTTSTVRFEAVSYTAFGRSFLDNVSVTAVSTVPEANSWTLMGLGLATLSVARRQRRAATSRP